MRAFVCNMKIRWKPVKQSATILSCFRQHISWTLVMPFFKSSSTKRGFGSSSFGGASGETPKLTGSPSKDSIVSQVRLLPCYCVSFRPSLLPRIYTQQSCRQSSPFHMIPFRLTWSRFYELSNSLISSSQLYSNRFHYFTITSFPYSHIPRAFPSSPYSSEHISLTQ